MSIPDRRKHKERKKKKARKIYPHDIKAKLANHLCNCSCPMCCNPRHSLYHKGKNKLTMQELKSLESMEDQDVHGTG